MDKRRRIMTHKILDGTAAAVTTTAIAWGPMLDEINKLLTGISLLLGIAFLLWRWHRAAKTPPNVPLIEGG